MNTTGSLDAVRRVADAVLYEGYVLYPYRASAPKNRSRWQFGVLVPEAYLDVDPSERAMFRSECVLESTVDNGATQDTSIRVVVRFLQIQRRGVEALDPAGGYTPVEMLEVDGVPLFAWDEAVEQEVTVDCGLAQVVAATVEFPFHVDGGEDVEPVGDDGRLVRRRVPVDGAVVVSAHPLPGPWRAVRLRVQVENRTTPAGPAGDREAALPAALVSAHAIITATPGAFVSMVDPPEWAAAEVGACANDGVWPVLAGSPDTMLCSPIILYDNPELAPESPGDLYDGTEIDEILTLRTMALTDDEKRQARATDPRAAAVIDRTDSLDGATLIGLHGTIRRPGAQTTGPGDKVPGDKVPDDKVPGDKVPTFGEPDFWAERPGAVQEIEVSGRRVANGSQVRLRPGTRRTDAQDMFLTGRVATVEAVLHDIDDNLYVAVTLDDDPAADLKRSHGRFLYFSPDEVEPV